MSRIQNANAVQTVAVLVSSEKKIKAQTVKVKQTHKAAMRCISAVSQERVKAGASTCFHSLVCH
jgi:hypothetical protein